MSAFMRYNEHIEERSFYHILMLGDVPKGSDQLFDIRKNSNDNNKEKRDGKKYGKEDMSDKKGEKSSK